MAGVAEKARFYLERAVPQLREFEEKEIFTKDEIRSLVKKRSEFEHRVLSPGTKPADFLAYVAWEQSLDSLRAKRCVRLKIKHSTSHAANARIFQIYERAVARHPGSALLWRRYLDFAAAAKATKRWRRIMTRALRLHPTDAGLWAIAGRRSARNGDMDGARAYFMRGCRFCNQEAALWVEYARVEMEWLGRIEGRKGAGPKAMDFVRAAEQVDEEDVIGLGGDSDEDDDDFGQAEEELVLPGQKEKEKERRKMFNEEARQKLEKSPAMEGAIPRAIFEVSRKQPFFSAPSAEAFFAMFASFINVTAQPLLVQHVLDSMAEQYPRHPSTCSCLVRQPLIGVEPDVAAFPKALRESLAILNSSMETTEDKAALAAKTLGWMEPILAQEDLDAGIRTVLEHTKRRLENP